jgi:hypothetical protein
MSQRPGRHQRRASQSVFSLPENFASLDDVPADGGEQRKPAAADAASEQQPARPAGRHRRTMSMAVTASLDMIAEDIGNYKYGA